MDRTVSRPQFLSTRTELNAATVMGYGLQVLLLGPFASFARCSWSWLRKCSISNSQLQIIIL